MDFARLQAALPGLYLFTQRGNMRGVLSEKIERFPVQMHERQPLCQSFSLAGGVLLEQEKTVGHYRLIYKSKSFFKIKND
jgi:hypothetical protein